MLAFALSVVVLILFRIYFVKEAPPEPKKATPTVAATSARQAPAPKATAPPGPAAPTAPAALPVTQGAKAEEIVVESKFYRVTFSTVGAVVRSWVLKDLQGGQTETIDSHICESLGFPLRLSLADAALDSEINQAIFALKTSHAAVSPPGQELAKLAGNTFSPPVTLTFSYSNGRVQVEKRFSFGDRYSVQTEISAFDGRRHLPVEVTWPGGFGDRSAPPASAALVERAAYEVADDSKVHEVTLTPSFFGRFFSGGSGAGANENQQDIAGPVVFAGLEDRFFASIFLPESSDTKARISREVWTPPNWQGEEKNKPRPLAVSLANTGADRLGFRLFVGPKSLDVLKSVNPPLDSLVDFGWFSVVAKPLFMALRYIDEHWIHNYGWAIVLLTIAINMGMFPLKLKSIRSAQEMQRIQPIIKGIQDKYKNYKLSDPRKQKMNEEIMKVYSEHHINPLGGCLPMLLQMPFLYGFYRVLDVTFELRHAPWIWWVRDLSAPDRLVIMGVPIPVLVILMTVVSFILQRMTPMATVDPSQQRMMMLMPLFFAFMFYRLASGMVLYWLTSSGVQVLQQVLINRRMPPPATSPPVSRRPAEAKG